jgi:outer membrane protein assembly factor BamB
VCEAAPGVWSTFQHDVAHSGYNAEETFTPPLTLAWSKRIKPSLPLSPVAVEKGRAFVSVSNRFASAAPLYALSASDGTELWSQNFGSVYSLGSPCVFSGSVYLANGKDLPQPPASLWVFDASSGALRWLAPLSADFETYGAPIVAGGRAYVQAGLPGGVYGFLANDGERVLLQTLERAELTSASYFGQALYTLTPAYARRHDATTGAIQASAEFPDTNIDPGYRAIAFGRSLGYVVSGGSLTAIDPRTLATRWVASASYTTSPAVADDTVYAISDGHLIARDATTGALLFTFSADHQLRYPPVVASGHVFVASDQHTYAVDVATHVAVWSVAYGGFLSLAAHRLFIAGADGRLSAYALTAP